MQFRLCNTIRLNRQYHKVTTLTYSYIEQLSITSTGRVFVLNHCFQKSNA